MKCLELLLEAKRTSGKPIGAYRENKYAVVTGSLQKLAGKEELDTILKDIKKVRKLHEAILASDYSTNYQKDLKIALKSVWKVSNGYELEDSPKEIRWIKTTIARRDRKLPTGLLTDEDVEKLLKNADGKYKAIIALLYEAGLRISELCALKKSDIVFVKEGARVNVPAGTKTGARSVLIIDSVPLLAAYLSQHPKKGENTPLFLADWGANKAIGGAGVRKRIKEIAVMAGVKKRIYPHLFRHSAATRLAKHISDASMKTYFGWEQDSTMAATYIHMSGKDVDDGILQMHNRPVKKEEVEETFDPQICTRCGKQNAHDAILCQYCGMPSNKDKAKLDDISREEKMKNMAELISLMAKEMPSDNENVKWLLQELAEDYDLNKPKKKPRNDEEEANDMLERLKKVNMPKKKKDKEN